MSHDAWGSAEYMVFDHRKITDDEQLWWAALKRVLRRQPRTVELHAWDAGGGGEIRIAEAGSWTKAGAEPTDQHNSAWEGVAVPRMRGMDHGT